MFAALSILFCMTCSFLDDNILAVDRNLTELEKRLVGTWTWNLNYDTDTVTFRDDLTYESKRKGSFYDGTYALDTDSLLKFTRRVILNGTEFQEDMYYDMEWMERDRFQIAAYNASMIYRRIR